MPSMLPRQVLQKEVINPPEGWHRKALGRAR